MTRKPKYLYGPVPSRRLGRSLGVDIIPYKICTYDCIYCQLGRTTQKTVERKEYVPFADVKKDIEDTLSRGVKADYITISGSGEPTLHSKLHHLTRAIKEMTDIPLAVITNGSLLGDAAVRDALAYADLVVPSLDAGDETMFAYVNRPHPEITFENMVTGLVDFRQQFRNTMWLEVLLLDGTPGLDAGVEKIAQLTERIQPDMVQLNTVARPPAEDFAGRVPMSKMRRLARLFPVKTECIAPYQGDKTVSGRAATDDVFALIRRRPCSLYDVARGLGISHNEALKHLDALIERGCIRTRVKNSELFYTADGSG